VKINVRFVILHFSRLPVGCKGSGILLERELWFIEEVKPKAEHRADPIFEPVETLLHQLLSTQAQVLGCVPLLFVQDTG
jgi:hypothetical protein